MLPTDVRVARAWDLIFALESLYTLLAQEAEKVPTAGRIRILIREFVHDLRGYASDPVGAFGNPRYYELVQVLELREPPSKERVRAWVRAVRSGKP